LCGENPVRTRMLCGPSKLSVADFMPLTITSITIDADNRKLQDEAGGWSCPKFK